MNPTNLPNRVWDDLRAYYDQHGIGILCCCPVDQYSQEVVFYHDVDRLEDPLKRFVQIAIREVLAKFKTDIEVYRMEIVCNHRVRVPLLFHQVVCMFRLRTRQLIVSDNMTDFVVDDEDEPCIEVYFWKSGHNL